MDSLDRRYTGHLDRRLDSTAEEKTTEGRAGREEFRVGLGFILMFELDAFLNLLVFRTHPRVIFVTMSVELGQGFQTQLIFPMVNEPTRRLEFC